MPVSYGLRPQTWTLCGLAGFLTEGNFLQKAIQSLVIDVSH